MLKDNSPKIVMRKMKLKIIVFNLMPDRDAKLKFSVSEGIRLDSVWLAN